MTFRMRTLSTVAAAAVAVTAVMSTVSAQPPAGRGQGGRGAPGRAFPVLGHLNLTEAQREQIRELTAQQRSDPEQAGARKGGELRRALRTAIFADAPDLAQIEQLKADIAQAEAAALAARMDLQLKIAQILTPEQRKQARESTGPGPGRARRDTAGLRGMRSMH